jgi:hypothetical protein
MGKISNANFEILEKIVDTLVVDVFEMLNRGTSGVFYLPEETGEIPIYIIGEGVNDLTLEFEVIQDRTIIKPEVDGEYVPKEGVVVLQVVYNPNENIKGIIEDITPEIYEILTHEVVHFLQEEAGFEFPEKEPKKSVKYYKQKHEIEAQVKGFERQSKVTKKEIEQVMKDWFEKYPHKHNLKPKEVDKVIKTLLKHYGKKRRNS